MSGYSIQGGSENPTLDYVVSDAATGAPMRVTIATGVMALVFDHGMLRVNKGGSGNDPKQQMGFYVPGVPPISTPSAVVTAELFLSQVGIYDSKSVSSMQMHGVGDVHGSVVADPQRGGQGAVYVSFSAVGQDPLVVRYRVTVYRPHG